MSNATTRDSTRSNDEIRNDLIKLAEIFLSDGLNRTLDNVRDREKEGMIPTEDATKFYTAFAKKYDSFLEPYNFDGSLPKLKHSQYYNPNQLFKENKNGATKNLVYSIYDLYLFYSKYDHLGVLSLDILRTERKEERIANVLFYLTQYSLIIHYLLRECFNKDPFIDTQIEQIKHLFENMKATSDSPYPL